MVDELDTIDSVPHGRCSHCDGKGYITKPFTVGQLLEYFPTFYSGVCELLDLTRPKNDLPYPLIKGEPIMLPSVGTKAINNYLDTVVQINSFFHFLTGLVNSIDVVVESVRKVLTLPGGGTLIPKDKNIESLDFDATNYAAALRQHSQFLSEVVLVRLVESYLHYLSSLLFEIFTQRPETMKSSEKIDVETVLSQGSLENLVNSGIQGRS